MMKIEFKKYQCGGNDFILIGDKYNLYERISPSTWVGICNRRFGIGSDGILLVKSEEALAADYRLTYLNSDGYSADLCGNGLMCTVKELGLPKIQIICSKAIYSGWLSKSLNAKIEFSLIYDYNRYYKQLLHECSEFKSVFFVNTGVPHLCLEIENENALYKLNVRKHGKHFCHHLLFAPEKTNVNFFVKSQKTENKLYVRTYERGVFDETLACGTGLMACSIAHLHHYGDKNKDRDIQKLQLNTIGGKYCSIIKEKSNKFYLIGRPSEVFSGVIFLNTKV